MLTYNVSDILSLLMYTGLFIYAVMVVKKTENKKVQKDSDDKTLNVNLLSEF